ncbi:MAG: hypothetical protein ABJN61_11710 [Flavobacteriaceae bacterium]|uniref:hypothetical protein n=1 Tax=Nonlabens ulvanivorans TaxID=906888 RepID=UPI0032987FEE
MRSYEHLNAVSRKVNSFEKDSDVIEAIDDYIPELFDSISSDFSSHFGVSLNLEKSHVCYMDQTYRQSATGVIFEAITISKVPVKLFIECLIDHSKVWLKVKSPVPRFGMKKLRKLAKSQLQNPEDHTELRNLN